jgi:hypothetical protein
MGKKRTWPKRPREVAVPPPFHNDVSIDHIARIAEVGHWLRRQGIRLLDIAM